MDNREFIFKLKEMFLSIKKNKSDVRFEDGIKGMIPVLMILFHSEEEITPKDIEDRLHITSARTARVLNQLQEKNLISRIKSEDNKKKTIIILTDEGKNLALKHHNMFNSYIDTVLNGITDEEKIEFLHIVEKMTNNLKERKID